MAKIIRSIETSIPKENLGMLVSMFDAAGLGLALRQSHTVLTNKNDNTRGDISVSILSADGKKAVNLIREFRSAGWAENPRIATVTMPETQLGPESEERVRKFFEELRGLTL